MWEVTTSMFLVKLHMIHFQNINSIGLSCNIPTPPKTKQLPCLYRERTLQLCKQKVNSEVLTGPPLGVPPSPCANI